MSVVDVAPSSDRAPKRSQTSSLPRLVRFKIAQLFHELTITTAQAAAAETLARTHGITSTDVLTFAEEFPRERLWRL